MQRVFRGNRVRMMAALQRCIRRHIGAGTIVHTSVRPMLASDALPAITCIQRAARRRQRKRKRDAIYVDGAAP